MRHILISITSVVLIFAFGCAGSRTTKTTPSFQVNQNTQIYQIFGMDCPGCHGGVEKLINQIPGVVASEANWEQQLLWVQTMPGATVSSDEIMKAIAEANFTAGKRIQ